MRKIKPGLVLELVANLLLPWLAYRLALPRCPRMNGPSGDGLRG